MQPGLAKRITIATFLPIILIIVSGCSSGTQTIEEAPTKADIPPPPPVLTGPDRLADTAWRAVSILGKPAGTATSSLIFSDLNSVSGSGGCNNFQGGVSIGSSSIAFGPLATTRKFCTPPVNGQETVYLEALELSRSWDLSGTKLELLDEANSVVILFNQQ